MTFQKQTFKIFPVKKIIDTDRTSVFECMLYMWHHGDESCAEENCFGQRAAEAVPRNFGVNPPYPFVLSLLFRVKAKGTKFFVVRAVWRVISGQSVGKTIIILTLRIES